MRMRRFVAGGRAVQARWTRCTQRRPRRGCFLPRLMHRRGAQGRSIQGPPRQIRLLVVSEFAVASGQCIGHGRGRARAKQGRCPRADGLRCTDGLVVRMCVCVCVCAVQVVFFCIGVVLPGMRGDRRTRCGRRSRRGQPPSVCSILLLLLVSVRGRMRRPRRRGDGPTRPGTGHAALVIVIGGVGRDPGAERRHGPGQQGGQRIRARARARACLAMAKRSRPPVCGSLLAGQHSTHVLTVTRPRQQRMRQLANFIAQQRQPRGRRANGRGGRARAPRLWLRQLRGRALLGMGVLVLVVLRRVLCGQERVQRDGRHVHGHQRIGARGRYHAWRRRPLLCVAQLQQRQLRRHGRL